MAKSSIPLYDICTINDSSQKDLLIEEYKPYLKKHYQNLHLPHRHSFYHFVLFTKGKGWHTIDFEKFSVKPFQMYFMMPGQVHSWHFNNDVDGYLVHFNSVLFSNFLYNSNYVQQFYFFKGIAKNGVCQLPASIHTDVVNIFKILLQEFNNGDAQSLDVIRLKLLELFILVERNCGIKNERSLPKQKLIMLHYFQSLIEQHYKNIRLPKEYADLMYITPNHLNALCQDVMGKTAGEIIRDRIVLEAKRLLTNANMTVTQIAYELTFEDNSYFNRFFKKNVGSTPDEFRKAFLKQ